MEVHLLIMAIILMCRSCKLNSVVVTLDQKIVMIGCETITFRSYFNSLSAIFGNKFDLNGTQIKIVFQWYSELEKDT